MSVPPILPVKFGAVLLPIVSFLSLLLAINYETDEGITLGRVEFAGYVLITPCMALSVVSFAFYLLSKYGRVHEGIQYCVILLLTMLSWYVGSFVVELTDF